MSFLRPVKMVKVGVVGLKDDRDRILTVLHDLNVLQIEPLSKEALGHLEPEHGSELQRTIGDLIVRFRGLKSALPPTPGGAPRRFQDLQELIQAAGQIPIDDEVGRLKREEDAKLTERKAVVDELALLARHPYFQEPFELLTSRNVVSFFGEAKPERFAQLRAEMPADAHLVVGPAETSVPFLITVPTAQADTVARLAQQRGATLALAPRRVGRASELRPQLETERAAVDARLEEIRSRLLALSKEWYPLVLSLDEALSIENRKLEVFARMGASARTFAVEGWIPVRERAALESSLRAATGERSHTYDLPTHEEPPTLMDNPAGVRRFEFFIRFYSLPQSSEWDPTWIFAVVFPIFFGIMLGDWGYAVVILGFCVWMIAGFPGRQGVPGFLKNFLKRIMSPESMRAIAYALVPGCLIGILTGVIFNSFFGFQVLPTPYIDPISTKGVSTLLLLSGYIGLAMVCFGFFLGVLKEYFHHHIAEAVSKVGAILLALGISFFGLGVLHAHSISPSQVPGAALWLGTILLGFALYLGAAYAAHKGEGIREAGMGSIEVVSHILSYTRLVGILLASAVLALVAKDIGLGLLGRGIGGAVAGAAIIFVVAMFNIVLGVFEPGIQGARLIFVENFSKYYTGNGRAFRPFGSRRTHTLPLHAGGSGSPLPSANSPTSH